MITAKQMEVIARAESYSYGFLYRWPGGFWSELNPEISLIKFNRWENWSASTRVVQSLINKKLATVTAWKRNSSGTFPVAVKIKAP